MNLYHNTFKRYNVKTIKKYVILAFRNIEAENV